MIHILFLLSFYLMPRNTLKHLGLNESEIKIYLTALSLGRSPASIIAKKSGIKRSTTYTIINKLSNSGFITSFEKNNIHFFSAIEPELLLDRFKIKVNKAIEHMNKFEKIIPMLESLKDHESHFNVKLFTGIEGMKALFEDVIISKPTQPLYAILTIHNMCDEIKKYLTEYYCPMRRKHVKPEFKSNTIVLDNEISKAYMKKNFKDFQYDQIVLLKNDLPLDITIQLYDNKAAFYSLEAGNNQHGVLIESESISKTVRTMFTYVFEYSKIISNKRERK